MKCVVQTETKISPTDIISLKEKRKKIQRIAAGYNAPTDIFLPEESFYVDKPSEQDAQAMLTALLHWLKIKHSNLRVHIDFTQEWAQSYQASKHAPRITLGWRFLTSPFLCGTAIAHMLAHHLLLTRHKLILKDSKGNEELAELLVIHLGLGVILLNGVTIRSESLRGLTLTLFIEEFNEYISKKHLVPGVWQPYTLPKSAKLLQSSSPHLPRKPHITYPDKQKMQVRWNFALVCLSIVILLGSIVFITRKPESPVVADSMNQLKVLRAKYEACLADIAYKKDAWSQDDIFIDKTINSEHVQCASLKNQYNYLAKKIKQETL